MRSCLKSAPPSDRGPRPNAHRNFLKNDLCRSRQPHQRLSHADPRAFPDTVAQRIAIRPEHDRCRAMLKPAEFLAFAERSIAGEDIRPAMLEVQQHNET